MSEVMEASVILAGRACGELLIDRNERFSFRYLAKYVQDDSPSLSVSMPLREAVYEDAVAFPWFENLLPEGELRYLISRDLGTDVQHISRLLARLGGDVAGAVSLELPDASGDGAGDLEDKIDIRVGEALDEEALGAVLAEAGQHPFLASRARGPRLSLAGAQHKLPVILGADGVSVSVGGVSTHLLKPPNPHFPGLPYNEFICMRAAKVAGLDVADVVLRSYRSPEDVVSGTRSTCLQITRYDRIAGREGYESRRLHQEDVCQATGIVSFRKYEAEGGPGMAALFDVLRRYSATPAKDIVELLKRVFYNLLIGNEDAHGKNFSLLYPFTHLRTAQRTRPVLAPAYDLVSTAVYPDLSRDMAMSFGGAITFEQVTTEHLTRFGEETGTRPARMRKLLLGFLDDAVAALQQTARELPLASSDVSHSVEALLSQSQSRYVTLRALLGKR